MKRSASVAEELARGLHVDPEVNDLRSIRFSRLCGRVQQGDKSLPVTKLKVVSSRRWRNFGANEERPSLFSGVFVIVFDGHALRF